MKKILLISCFVPILWSCNKTIEVTPKTATVNKTIVPDFNFLASAAYDFVYPNVKQTYVLPLELYLRPFDGVRDTTSFVLEFGSSQYAQLMILKDTLLPGDKIKIYYSDFNKFRMMPIYQSVISGEHTLNFSITSSNVKKSASIKISAKI